MACCITGSVSDKGMNLPPFRRPSLTRVVSKPVSEVKLEFFKYIHNYLLINGRIIWWLLKHEQSGITINVEKMTVKVNRKLHRCCSKDFGRLTAKTFFYKTDMTRGTSNLLQYLTTRTENAPLLGPCSNLCVPPQTGSGWAEEEVRRAQVNFPFDNLEGQNEVSSEASVFQREEIELAKPFLIWHVMETSNQPCCMALDPLQV